MDECMALVSLVQRRFGSSKHCSPEGHMSAEPQVERRPLLPPTTATPSAQDMFTNWMFFRVTLDMLEMVFAKADPRVVKM